MAHARLRLSTPGGGEMLYRLDHKSSLHSQFKRSGELDCQLEADFAREFEQKVGGKRGHWQLTRESEDSCSEIRSWCQILCWSIPKMRIDVSSSNWLVSGIPSTC